MNTPPKRCLEEHETSSVALSGNRTCRYLQPVLRALLVGLVGVSLKLQLPLPAQAEVTKAQADGGFSVSGTKIYNPQGREFVIKGVNIHGPNAPWPDDLTQPVHLDNIANCWKFNLVRVNSRILPTGQGTVYTDNNDTDKLVNAFTKRGIVVMFDAHDRTGGYYEAEDGSLQKLKSWYRELAQKHKDNPYVWFNVMNEPGVARKPDQILPDKKKWLTVHREVIQVIREEVGAKNLIVVDGAAWGQDAASWDAEPIPQQNSAILQYAEDVIDFNGKTYPNIIFAVHPYDQYNRGDTQQVKNQRLADYFDRVRAQDLVIMVGEFGSKNSREDTTPVVEAIYRTAVPRGIGRIVWNWWGGDKNDLTTSGNGGGWHINSCTNPTNLTWLGEQVWRDTHSEQ